MNKVKAEFMELHGFERDFPHPELGNIITPPLVQQVMGYNQMNYYTPLKPKGSC